MILWCLTLYPWGRAGVSFWCQNGKTTSQFIRPEKRPLPGLWYRLSTYVNLYEVILDKIWTNIDNFFYTAYWNWYQLYHLALRSSVLIPGRSFLIWEANSSPLAGSAVKKILDELRRLIFLIFPFFLRWISILEISFRLTFRHSFLPNIIEKVIFSEFIKYFVRIFWTIIKAGPRKATRLNRLKSNDTAIQVRHMAANIEKIIILFISRFSNTWYWYCICIIKSHDFNYKCNK